MLLLTIIYIAFVGLGLPDSMFGTAWPAIYGEWGLPFSYGSFVVSIIYCCTIISCLMSARVIKRFGTAKVTASSTAITALAMAGFAVSETFAALCICAIPLGLGAGAIDTALNNYVASHYSARVMNYLHYFLFSCHPEQKPAAAVFLSALCQLILCLKTVQSAFFFRSSRFLLRCSRFCFSDSNTSTAASVSSADHSCPEEQTFAHGQIVS